MTSSSFHPRCVSGRCPRARRCDGPASAAAPPPWRPSPPPGSAPRRGAGRPAAAPAGSARSGAPLRTRARAARLARHALKQAFSGAWSAATTSDATKNDEKQRVSTFPHAFLHAVAGRAHPGTPTRIKRAAQGHLSRSSQAFAGIRGL